LITKPAEARQAYGDWFTPLLVSLSWFANLFLVQIYLPVASFEDLWNPPAWSIATELIFYITFPSYCVFLNRFTNTTSLLIFGCKLFAIETVAYLGIVLVVFHLTSKSVDFVDWIPYRLPFFRIWEFFIGCILGAVFVRDRQRVESHPLVKQLRNTTCRNLVLALTLIGIVILAASSIVEPNAPLATLRRVLHWYVPYTPLLALIIITLAFGKTFVSPILEHR
jgi:peptidoglycan/LPS O-acetylase OafA/YrhL